MLAIQIEFIFSHACTEMATFLPETRKENPLFGVHTKNAVVINNSRGNYQKLSYMGEQLRDLR